MPKAQQTHRSRFILFGPDGWIEQLRKRKSAKSGEMAHVLRSSPNERAECTDEVNSDTRRGY